MCVCLHYRMDPKFRRRRDGHVSLYDTIAKKIKDDGLGLCHHTGSKKQQGLQFCCAVETQIMNGTYNNNLDSNQALRRYISHYPEGIQLSATQFKLEARTNHSHSVPATNSSKTSASSAEPSTSLLPSLNSP